MGSIIISPKSSFLISAISLWMRFSAIYETSEGQFGHQEARKRTHHRSLFGSHWGREVIVTHPA